MKSAHLLLLASLAVCKLQKSGGQAVPGEDGTGERGTIDDMILRRAERILLSSILKKMEDQDGAREGVSTQEWVTKRQHPGKRFDEEFEKRQHPGRREEEEEEDEDEEGYGALEKRQHPGKRSALQGHTSDNSNPVDLRDELSKRQHPGKRYLMLPSKRQHPGKRRVQGEDEDGDAEDEDGTPPEEEEEEGEPVEKRQHPGKRFWDSSSPDFGTNGPCGPVDLSGCSRTGSLLLDLLDTVKSRAEEKRQHPGKRQALQEALLQEE